MKKLFLISCALLLTAANFASAGITNPYTVDEKLQVLFGDSASITTASTTYLGFENYSHDYVNHFLHITFTYARNGGAGFGCGLSAGYPPQLYITNSDPRATTTPPLRFQAVVYHPHMQHDCSINWYLYDIQFDATGYRWIVKQSGETEILNLYLNIVDFANTDWAALANHYPNSGNAFSMAFTPLPIRDDVVPAKPDPVIIVPGIMGSAYKNGVWVIDPILHTYDDLIATLVANGYVKDKDLFTFPYEWRDSNVFSANLLDAKITAVKAVCQCNKVDIVAHSMGGLVARSYIQSGSYDQDVDQVIFLGTPHKGAPTSYLRWEAGEFEDGAFNFLTKKFFEAEALKNGHSSLFNYIRNRPILSVQELLPITNYLKDKSTGIIRTYPTKYPRNNFLETLNSNISNLLDSGVRITNVIGNTGSNTTINMIRVGESSNLSWVDGKPDGFDGQTADRGLEKGGGDVTATIVGATLDGSIPNIEIQSSHQRLPTLAEGEIFKILTGKTASTTYDSGTNLDAKVLLLQLLSPIDVVVTAPDGKKIGKNFSSGTEYAEIPNAFYSGFTTDTEFITIFNPIDGD